MIRAWVWIVLFYGWTLSELGILLVTRTRRSTGTVQDRGSLRVLWAVIGISIVVGTWLGDSGPHTIFGGVPWVRWVALGLMVAGLTIRWTAIVTLGRSFSANVAIHATQRLQRNGLFGVVRHPSYTGLVMIFAAVGMYTRNWVGLAVLVVPTTAALLYRIHVEERALGGAFGEEYVEYCRTTKRLVPGVY